MRSTTTLVCCLLLSSLVWGVTASTSPIQRADSPVSADPKAVALWELAIKAKGGRERLYAARNMVAAYDDKTNVALNVFPNKAWEWTDNRPTP